MRTVGEWDLDLDLGELRRGIEVVRLTPRSLQVLQYLVDHPGVLVSADSLLSEFWRGAISSDNAVAKAITEIRRALGDDPKSPSYIKTLPRRGYTLVAPVTRRDGKHANVAIVGVCLFPLLKMAPTI